MTDNIGGPSVHTRRLSKSQIKKLKLQMQEASSKRENELKQKEQNKKLQEEIQADNLLKEFDKIKSNDDI